MNQTTRRKARHLLHFLITLVVISCQIALPLGALVAAIQPTPQMAAAAARQVGLGDWLAQSVGDLTAKAQPLWGEPASAQAATTYGNPVALLSTTHTATITNGRTGLCTALNCFITNPANVVDANTTNFGNISIPLGLAGAVYFAVDTSVTFPAGYRAGFLVDNGGGLIDLSLFSSFSIKTYLNGTLQETASSAALLDVSLFGGANSNAISFVTTKAFDEVRLEAGSLIGALLDLDVYYAFVQEPTYSVSAAPGGVTSGLRAWVKADSGISASDGAAVTTWSDQSGNSYNFTQATGAAQPTYYSTTVGKLLNFNSVVDFDGSGDYLRNTGVLMPSASAYTFLAVGVDEDTGTAYRKIFGSEGIVDYFGLYKQGGATGDNGWIPYAIGGQARSSPFIGDRGSMGKGTKYSADGGANGYWNGTNFTSDSRTDYAQPQIVGFNSLNSATSDPFYTWTDGYKEDPNWSPIVDGLTFRNQFFTQTSIGADITVELWKGRIPEFMAYSQSLSDSDIAKINTYLAIKYGITLGQGNGHVGKNGNNYNYVATDGTTIWSAATNSTYAYNIAGIGRDDAEALNQKQSQSIQAGFQPVIGVGAIAATNAANSGSFSADKSYLVWGDNGQSASFGAVYNPTSFTPAGGYFRMNRVWKVQETGTVGNVVVQGSGADHLLVSSDPTFASGVTEIAFSSGSATVNFSNGQFFTFGRELLAPGGVAAGLGVWLRADQGPSTTTDGQAVSAWNDFSGAGNDVAQATAANQPKFKVGNLNFNPALEFDGSDDVLFKSDGTTIIPNQTDPVSMLTVSTQRAGSGWWQTLLSFSGPADYPSLHWLDGRQALYIDGVQDFRHSAVIPYNTPTIFVSRANNATPRDLRMANNGLSNQDTSTVGGGTFPAASGSKLFSVGSEVATGSETLNGFMNEGIVYNRFLTDPEVNRIHTYFAIKYGLMFDNGATDYVATDGTTKIWDATANSAYKNNIAGIGRDDAEALAQKQSKSINSGFQPTIGLGTIAATNAANTNSFAANKSYLVWGDNGQAASYGVSYTPGNYIPAGGYYRMNRVWKVKETGTITNVVVQASGANHLLVSSDPAFASGVTEVAMTGDQATVNFSDGQFFTFGRDITAPGGVAAPAVWLKADSGTNTTTDGANVSSWVNNGSSGGTAGQLVSCAFPTFTVNKHNFNPAITDNSTNCNGALLLNDVFPTYVHRDLTSFILRSQPDVTQQRTMISYSEANNFTTVEKPWYASQSANQSWLWWDGNYQAIGTFPTAASRVNGVPQINAYAMPQWISGAHTANLYLNGANTTVSGGINAAVGIGKHLFISNDANNDNPSGGDTSEIITYDRILSAPEMQRINSYLALKYGITYLNAAGTAVPDYLAADGTTKVWDATANASYNNNIAGIGRDGASELNQKQSKSVNNGYQVTIGLGSIAATNAANNSNFAVNKSFLLWGDNNQAATYGVSYTPSSFTPSAGYYRMNRIWKVQETGTITNVVVQADGADHLMVSSDPTFATGVTEIAFSSGSATVNFTNGQFFTFGKTQIAPGGVATNLQFWLKADAIAGADGGSVSTWNSAGGDLASFAVTQGAASNQPILYTSAASELVNFNPSLDFTSASQHYLNTTTPIASASSPYAVFVVAQDEEATTETWRNIVWAADQSGNDYNFTIYKNRGGTAASNGIRGWGAGGDMGNATLSQQATIYGPLNAGYWNGSSYTRDASVQVIRPQVLGWSSTAPNANGTSYIDGFSSATTVNFGASANTFQGFSVGRDAAGGGYWPWEGKINEVIFYNKNISAAEARQISSYLALKYGVTLAHDYLASDGATTAWGISVNTGYNNNIAGIGRDDASALNQKQSKSANGSLQPTIGLGTIAAANAANSSTFAANKSFLLWGDNNGALTLSAAYNGVSNSRLARVWKVQETGTVGAVKIVLPRSAVPTVGLRSLIVHSSDGNFGTVDRTIPLTSQGGNYVATVNFNNGDFFTFSSSSSLPEINVTPLTIDFGTVNSGSTAAAQAVTIQNQGDVSLSLSSIALSGADAARFAISSNNCGAALNAGASCTVQLTFTPATAGNRIAQLVITSNDSDESTVNVALSGATPSSNGGSNPGTYNLAVTKSASVSNATIGTPFTYTITVWNKGTIAATNVVMTDPLPAGVTFGSANATGGGNCSHSSGTVTCTWPSLAGGASATVTISVTP